MRTTMSRLNFRKVIKKLHLWIGLCTGVVVFIVCITGCIYTFQKEIRLFAYPYYKVDSYEGQEKLPLSVQVKKYQELKLGKLLRIYDMKDRERSTMLLTLKNKEYYFVFLNPYNAELLEEKALANDFFYVVLYIHMNLLLGKVGAQIVAWSVLLFVVSLITGIFLWVPKKKKMLLTKKGLKSKLTIKRKGKYFSRILGLHSVLGIYAFAILLVIGITGLAWAFPWVDGLLYKSVTWENKPAREKVEINETTFNLDVLDLMSSKMKDLFPEKQLTMYFVPTQTTLPLRIRIVNDEYEYGNSDIFYIHPKTGEEIKNKLYKDKNKGEKLRDLYYDLHTGSILGIPGKIIVFLASLIGASLPVSGFLLWRYRKRKKRNNLVTVR